LNRYNIPATADEKSHDNPWNFVRKVAKSEDYVVVKLDIDNTPIEEKFIAQLRASSDLHSLIDEFYFEHHVNVSLRQTTTSIYTAVMCYYYAVLRLRRVQLTGMYFYL
jgi:hypothetical protein